MKATLSKSVFVIVIIIVLLAAAGGWLWYTNLSGFVATDDAIVEGYQSTISSKILGRVSKLMAQENEKVSAGQLLVNLDDSDLRAQENQLKAVLAGAEQNVILAKINLQKNQNDFKRAVAQFRESYISKEQYDHTRSALDAAQAQVTIAECQVNTSQSQLGVIKTQLQNTQIVAPMNGVIAKRWALSGDIVQAGQSIFSMFDIKNVWITANFEETKIASLRVGQPVEITVDAYGGASFKGTVQAIGNNTAAQFSLIPANNAAGNFTKITQRIPVKIRIHKPTGSPELLPGMSAEVRVRVR
jgi:membrane fusion protein (multidrug efflux system)